MKVVMKLKNIPVRLRGKLKQRLFTSLLLVATLIFIGCTDRTINSTEQGVVTSPLTVAENKEGTEADNVVQVNGRVNANDVLEADENIEANNAATLLTLAGAVSPQGDRIVQVTNTIDPMQSIVTLSNNGNQLIKREQPWLVGPVKLSPNGQRIVTNGSDLTTRIWDEQLNQIASFDEHQTFVQALQISPDGNYILTTEYPDLIPAAQPANFNVTTVRLLNLQGTQLALFEGFFVGLRHAVQFSPDSQQLLMVKDGIVQLTDLQGNPQVTFNQQQKFDLAQFSPDGQSVLAAGAETMQLWDLQGNLKAEFSHWTLPPRDIQGNLEPEFRDWDSNLRSDITSIQFSRNGQWIATGSFNGVLRLWNAQSNQVVTIKAHEGSIHSIAFSPDGTQVATLGEKTASMLGENDIRLWNLEGDLREVLGGNPSTISSSELEKLSASFSVQFTPDGAYIVATQMGQIGTTIRWKL